MKFYHSMLTIFILFHLKDNLWSEQVGPVTSNSSKEDTNQSSLANEQYGGLEKIRLFDGSELTGRLIKLDKKLRLFLIINLISSLFLIISIYFDDNPSYRFSNYNLLTLSLFLINSLLTFFLPIFLSSKIFIA